MTYEGMSGQHMYNSNIGHARQRGRQLIGTILLREERVLALKILDLVEAIQMVEDVEQRIDNLLSMWYY